MSELAQEDLEHLRLLELEAGGDSLLDFVPRISPTFMRPDHLRPVADLIARAARGEEVRACVSAPPRHAKTETAVIHGIPWYLTMCPGNHVAYVTYEANLARAKSARARAVAEAAGIPLKHDSKSKSHWLTPQEGGLFATGVGGPLTGHGFHLAVVDDPVKNRVQAESATVRQTIREWFTSTMMTRIEPGGSVIVTHTRWVPDDLIGTLLKDTETHWEYVNLPAVYDEGTPQARSLWPRRWSLAAILKRMAEVGEYDAWSLYRGQPRPRGGRLFIEPPARYSLRDLAKILPVARILVSCDPAATAKTSADHAVIAVIAAVGYGPDMRLFVLDVQRMQAQTPVVQAYVRQAARKWRAPAGVEAVGGFKAVPQMMRLLDPSTPVLELYPVGDKFTRALPVAAAWARGLVLVPEDAPWLTPFLDEVFTFTGIEGGQDDQVDALSQGYNTLAGMMPQVRRGPMAAGGLPLG